MIHWVYACSVRTADSRQPIQFERVAFWISFCLSLEVLANRRASRYGLQHDKQDIVYIYILLLDVCNARTASRLTCLAVQTCTIRQLADQIHSSMNNINWPLPETMEKNEKTTCYLFNRQWESFDWNCGTFLLAQGCGDRMYRCTPRSTINNEIIYLHK